MSKTKNIPDEIYLQVDPYNEEPEDYNNLRGVTFSVDQINKNDIKYVRPNKTLEDVGALIDKMKFNNAAIELFMKEFKAELKSLNPGVKKIEKPHIKDYLNSQRTHTRVKDSEYENDLEKYCDKLEQELQDLKDGVIELINIFNKRKESGGMSRLLSHLTKLGEKALIK